MKLLSLLWRRADNRHAVVSGYVALGNTHREVLADIALRGGVFDTSLPPTEHALAFAAGKRALAMEIMKLAETPPAVLYAVIERQPVREAS